ncbi:dTDP-4-keto-6-deoxy-D-glucose epimerase [Nakamurella flava]|uniref:dTDP-4-keto-6-deoxy-D-glucose epimerase n=1 Tax=Nakamurella flava TaxID=2576308 RepID=A0A4U6QMB0_9ACTN|nr:dTDP-4-dehydrorhamnose 3,5-epimerase [Nakamurella flava]TKV61479.1 dTDP-4-keto-6-deoxy-D-glucose epimerase [Nakamurella flava]
MQVRALAVPGAFEFTPVQHGDSRGLFLEWFKVDKLSEAVGRPLDLQQANLSVSRAGTLRGVHFADVPPGQAKYVTCPRGAAIDFIVDIRVGSPTFGAVDAVRLDSEHRRAVYLAEGLGHAFLALEDDTTLTYLCSTGYSPGREHGINPLDPALGLPLPSGAELGTEFLLSDKDTSAPTLQEAADSGLLPTWEACRPYLAAPRTTTGE